MKIYYFRFGLLLIIKQKKCFLCEYSKEENPRIATLQLEDKEFKFQSTCDTHTNFQLNSVWWEDKKDIERLKKRLELEKDKLNKSLLKTFLNTVLVEKINKWKRIWINYRNYEPLERLISNYIQILGNKIAQLNYSFC